MSLRTLSLLTLAVGGLPVSASAQQETRFGAELRLEREHLADDCGSLKKLPSCAATVVMGHPFHVAFGSIAPQNGFGAGPAIVTHFTPKNWRLTWSGDAIFAAGGAWRAGTYFKIIRTKIEPPQLVKPGERVRPLRITEYPVYNLYTQSISLPELAFYGIGSDSAVEAKTVYSMSELIVGGNAAVPVRFAPPLKLGLLFQGNLRQLEIRDGATTDVPPIGTRFTDLTAPGLSTQPSFVQLGQGMRLRPWMFNDRLQFDYTLLYQQFISNESTFSFRRWTVDLNHLVPLYRTGGGPPLRDERNTPNECTTSQSDHACPSVTRDRWGSLSFRLLVSKSQVGDGGQVPFYLQRTLGGSDLNGQRLLASYDDYRFRGPHLLLFQGSIEHAVWGPIGASFSYERGAVAAQNSGLGRSLRHSVGVGATVRAGGFPLVTMSWHTGGPEGRHFIFTIDTSLLGGGGRPSLQ